MAAHALLETGHTRSRAAGGRGRVSGMDLKTLLQRIGGGHLPAENLRLDEAEALFGAMLDGEVPPMLLGALLIALRLKKETPEELAGFARAMGRRVTPLPLPPGPPRTVIIPSYALARSQQPNLMPLLALMLARFGLPVLIHGNPHPACRSQSFEVLSRLGYLPATSRGELESQLTLRNLAIAPLDLICPGLARLQKLRAVMGLGNVSDLAARLLDPNPGSCLRLICVSDPELLERLRRCVETDSADALVMRATDGEAYANPLRRPRIEFFNAFGSEILFQAGHGDVALPQTGADVTATVRQIGEILDGHRLPPQPILNQVAACLYASGYSPDLSHAKATVALGLPVSA